MKRILAAAAAAFLLGFGLSASTSVTLPSADLYGIGRWDGDSLGNHRIVVHVDRPADAVLATLDWRRRDSDPDKKEILVIDASTGERVTNVARLSCTRERGEIAFQPSSAPGDYYIYYLRNHNTKSRWYPQATYYPYEETADDAWIKRNRLNSAKTPKLPAASLVQYQSVDEFNSFYPMEVIATAAETESIAASDPDAAYILFTEDRRYPIRMTSDLPYRWVADGAHDSFAGTADKSEYYCFQVGVWAVRSDVNSLSVNFGPLVNEKTGESIPASAFTCFNTGGVDVTGTAFDKDCSVVKGKIQPLWIGTMVPEKLSAGVYKGSLEISSANAGSKTVAVALTVTDNVIANHGDNEPWRHSRLRWLNSQIGFDDEVVAPYLPIRVDGRRLSILGRDVTLGADGLPEQIDSYFEEAMTKVGDAARKILASPMCVAADGGSWDNLSFGFTKRKAGAVAWNATSQNDIFIMQVDGELEADGNITYKVNLIARKDASVRDISLSTEMAPGLTRYMMGLGEKGGYAHDLRWKWDVEKNQDAVWAGDVNAGLQLRFYDDRYERPLNTNFYHQKPLVMPESWCNGGKGGIDVEASASRIEAYSGSREVKKGDVLCYWFSVLVTPFRPLDTDKQWHDRYFHRYEFADRVADYGASVVNVHHATQINPYINYPYLRPQQMGAYADAVHALGMKFKIYDTVRELSNHAVELFALRSLGDEIFSSGDGGGYSWLQEHLDQDYIAAWFSSNVHCAAIVNTGVSRWHNYYMEGLDWLVKNVGIDGLYIDDLAFDRMSMKRVRKILTASNPGALIDLHSCNQFNPRDGYANSANLYLEHFPYLDKLWFGEEFDYDNPADFYLIEISGIPYGLMGEMLQNGGNKWRGMLYGMTARMPWSEDIDNRPIWKLWDEFGMKGSEMIGYWVGNCPVKTGSDKTLATVYSRKGEGALISVATWADNDDQVTLDIDWDALGLDPSKAVLHAPELNLFQPEMTWKPGDTITVPKGKGWLIEIRNGR